MLIPVQTVSKIPKNPQNPIKKCASVCVVQKFFWPGQCATLELQRAEQECADQERQTGRKNCLRRKVRIIGRFVKYHPKINLTYSGVHKSPPPFFSKILEKPSIVQKKMIPHINGLGFSLI